MLRLNSSYKKNVNFSNICFALLEYRFPIKLEMTGKDCQTQSITFFQSSWKCWKEKEIVTHIRNHNFALQMTLLYIPNTKSTLFIPFYTFVRKNEHHSRNTTPPF